jgi:hypothetical protein
VRQLLHLQLELLFQVGQLTLKLFTGLVVGILGAHGAICPDSDQHAVFQRVRDLHAGKNHVAVIMQVRHDGLADSMVLSLDLYSGSVAKLGIALICNPACAATMSASGLDGRSFQAWARRHKQGTLANWGWM